MLISIFRERNLNMKFNGMDLAFKYCQGIGAEFGPSSQNPFYLEKCFKIAPSDGVRYIYESDLIDWNFYSIEQEKNIKFYRKN